jgi:hypothetical protein
MRSSPPRITSIPLVALEQIAVAYGDRGTAQLRRSYATLCDEAIAHLFSFHGGREFDSESGLHHLAEAGAVIVQLLNAVYVESGEDDRPTPVRVNPEEVANELGISKRVVPVLSSPSEPDED